MSDVRVPAWFIETLFKSLTYKYERVGATTTTGCWAFLPMPNGTEFQMGYGESACVDPTNYIKTTGQYIARERCEQVAKNKLWELEGYLLAITGQTSADILKEVS